jgi:glycosyltransferase involved in cell wall biosynthesis
VVPLLRVAVAQIGARRHYAVPQALELVGCLERLVTDVCADLPPWRWLDAALPHCIRPYGLRRLLDRKIPFVPPKKIVTFPLFALSKVWESRPEHKADFWARRNAEFGRRSARAGFANADTVYAFNDSALELWQAAREQGLRTVLDQTAAPWRWNRQLFEEEAKLWPGWEERMVTDAGGRMLDREEREWKLSDRIICGSDFVKEALAKSGGPVERCVTVPYTLAHYCSIQTKRKDPKEGSLRVLFVGTLQLRKGIQYLWEAKRLLREEDLRVRVVGPSLLSEKALRELRHDFDIIGPVPRSQVWAHYAWADVFVLPTLSEGSANVLHEALAAGLPVITTPNVGAKLRDGEEALIVPIRDAQSLASALLRLIHGHWRPQKKSESWLSATAEATLSTYGRRLLAAMGTTV